ncbi:MAG: ABC transporter permease, partial [Acidipropionibacterium jensenii]|nr:ABC transporter permease [Acidipropionibacterium jensenii]
MSRGRNRKFKNQNRRQNQPEAAAQATPKAPEPADVPDPELVIDERPEDFWAGEVDEKQLQLLMGDWRKGRTTRNIWQALSDAYVMIFSLLVIVAMLVSLIIQAQGQASTCSAAGCRTARELLPWAALAGV